MHFHPAALPHHHLNISFAPQLYYAQCDFKRSLCHAGSGLDFCQLASRLYGALSDSHPPSSASLIHLRDSPYSSATTSPALDQSPAAPFPGHPIRRHLLKTVATATPMMDEESR